MEKYRLTGYEALACLTLAIWFAPPEMHHTAAVLEAAQQQTEASHEHDLKHDLYKLLHGHSHGDTDHDHSQVFSVVGEGSSFLAVCRNRCREPLPLPLQQRLFEIERPPRV